MSHSKNKVEWCLNKAEKELQEGDKHRGLRKVEPNMDLAQKHLRKAEHNLSAIVDFRNMGYGDWSASAAFYTIYQCFLAIIAKFGYESGNQECTFALIYYLIETDQIQIGKSAVEEVHELDQKKHSESPRIIDIRETKQYGIELSLDDQVFNKLLITSRTFLHQTKEILQTN